MGARGNRDNTSACAYARRRAEGQGEACSYKLGEWKAGEGGTSARWMGTDVDKTALTGDKEKGVAPRLRGAEGGTDTYTSTISNHRQQHPLTRVARCPEAVEGGDHAPAMFAWCAVPMGDASGQLKPMGMGRVVMGNAYVTSVASYILSSQAVLLGLFPVLLCTTSHGHTISVFDQHSSSHAALASFNGPPTAQYPSSSNQHIAVQVLLKLWH